MIKFAFETDSTLDFLGQDVRSVTEKVLKVNNGNKKSDDHSYFEYDTMNTYFYHRVYNKKTSFMIGFFAMLFLSSIFLSCTKENNDKQDKIVNGVNVNIAISTFNSFRTQGISGYSSVGAVTWNDTLSKAAYNYAKAKTEDTNTPSNIYLLSNGQIILDFPASLNYSRTANLALYYGFPASADVKTVINAGFATTDQTVLAKLMNRADKQFGMGQFGEKWFVIMSD